MKEIQLTKGQFAKVDDWNYEYYNQWKWQAKWDKKMQGYYAVRTEGKRPFRKTIRMHRQIANTPDGMHCDHINHDTLCNLEENLRNVTPSQNMMNRHGANSNNKLGEQCISPHGNGFQVHITKEGKTVFNKWFRKLETAIYVRDNEINKHHGEFSNIQLRNDNE